MPLKTNGGIIGPDNTPTSASAKGKWTLPESYKWTKAAAWPGAFQATGGTITNVGGYTIHTFTTSGTFNVVSGAFNVDYLVVAGGGGGAPYRGGGGGAGGFRTATGFPVTSVSYTHLRAHET